MEPQRHRPRCKSNPDYRHAIEAAGLICAGESPDGLLVEFVELADHPFWIGTQAHPEFKSRPLHPAPLFDGFVGAAVERAEGRNPQLIELDLDPSPGHTVLDAEADVA